MMTNTRSVRWALALVAIVMVGAVVAPVSGTAQESQSARVSAGQHPRVGADYHALWGDRTNAQRREMFERLAHIHAGWVRISFPWALAQPRRPTRGDKGWSAWGLNRVDTVVRMAKQSGLEISFTLTGTPRWANHGRGPSYLPSQPGSYARAIQFLAARYRGDVGSWEIWNEANHNTYLKGATVGDYSRLLCRAYPAVHRGAPGARVISAGTGGVDYRWIAKLYAHGAKSCFDVLAVHPYTRDISPRYGYASRPPLWIKGMTKVRHIMRHHHDAGTPVWFTEFGWSTHPDSFGYGVTRAQQAKFLVQMIKMTDRQLPYVARMSWYMAKDEHVSDVHHGNFGLYTSDMRPKPSARAMRRYLSGVG